MVKSLIGVVTLSLAGASAWALDDPTRPPPAFVPREPAAASAARTAAAGAAAAPLQLQSVLLSPTRRSAIISGETVTPGSLVRGLRVSEIHESHVVLLGPEGRQRLDLTPGVRKGAPGSLSPRDTRRLPKGDLR